MKPVAHFHLHFCPKCQRQFSCALRECEKIPRWLCYMGCRKKQKKASPWRIGRDKDGTPTRLWWGKGD